MTTPGGGFVEGDDYVAMRLSLDIPQEATKGIKDIADEVERYKVAMEAAIRAEADMTSYADKMTESTKKAAEAQANMTEQLKTYLELSGKITAQGQSMSSGVPAGPHQAPWEPGAAGTGAAPVPPGARMPNPSDVVYQLGDRAGGTHKDAASYLNMQHGRGGVPDTIAISPESIQSLATQIAERERAVNKTDQHTRPNNVPQRQPGPSQRHPSQSDPFDQFEDRVNTASGLAGQVMNEVMGGDGSRGGMGQLAVRGLDWARKKLEERAARTDAKTGGGDDGSGNPESDPQAKGGMSDLAGLAKMLGVGGGIATAALAAFGLYEKGGQMMQGWRNIASPRGGGAGEGFELAMRQRMLSMDPNISTQQSREIYQAMLSNGYADASGGGPQAEEVKNFLKTNIKQYNMDVTESMQALKLTAHTTKVSVSDLSDALYTLQQMAKGTTISQQELQRNFFQRWSQLEAQGVPEAAAMKAAMQAGGMFLHDPVLAGTFAQTNFTGEMGALQGIMGGPGGTPMNIPGIISPDNYGAWNQNMGTGNQASLEVLKSLALQYRDLYQDKSGGKNDKDPNWFEAKEEWIKAIAPLIGPDSPLNDHDTATAMYNQLAWGIDSQGNPVSSDPKEIVRQANKDTAAALRPETTTNWGTSMQIPGIGAIPIEGPHQEIMSKRERSIVEKFGGVDKVQVVNPDGSVWDLDTSNPDQAAGIAAGKYRLKRKGEGGKGMKLSDFPENINEDFSTEHPNDPKGKGPRKGDGKGGDNQVTGELTIKIDRNGNVSAPSSVPLTANNDAANRGSGDASVNNPPLSDQLKGLGNIISSLFPVSGI